MAEQFNEFNETTDLYLEILREAQRIEDKKKDLASKLVTVSL